MYIDTVFSPKELESRGDISNKTVVVIDVLRATTTIIYALWGYNNKSNMFTGCSKIIPVETIEEARDLYKKYDQNEVLLAGERFCLKPEGFDLGNSPADYASDKIQNKIIIFSTTNGTKALKLAQNARFITTAAFVNAVSCMERIFKEKNDVILLCAGRSGKTTKEDTACAGLIVKLLSNKCFETKITADLSDAADIALKYYEQCKNNILSMLRSAEAGQNLIDVNLERDLSDCCKINHIPIYTEYKNGCITGNLIK
jgi:2-phosphosulfolactate phosphatase